MNEITQPLVNEKLKNIQFISQCFIDGKYTNALSGKTFDCISPIDGKKLTQIARGEKEDVDLAVAAAKREFEKGSFKNLAPIERKNILLKFADLIEENRLELALLETLDMGKPISESFNVDLKVSLRSLRWYAECCDKIYDEIAPTAQPSLAMMVREPIGVVGAVVPWNFPLMMAIWKIAPALAVGNSVVLKPAEQSSLSALFLGKLSVEAGIPAGVFNVIAGFGNEAGKAIGLHPDVDCLAFTGSTQVGKLFMKYSAESNLKRVWLECGGKSPNIVFADCPNLDKVANAAASAIFYNQGEVCTAGSRLIVHASIKDELIKKVNEIAKTYQPSDPLNINTKLGAMVDDKQLETVKNYVESGKKEGAQLVCGGKQINQKSGGFYMEPTIFDNVNQKMTIAKEEIFGPVLSVITFTTDDEAIQIANDTQYGLAAAVWSKDINRAHLVSKAIQSGLVWVNCWDYDDITTAFGGFKQSGNGRDKSMHSLEKYTELKTIWINLEK